MEKKKGMTQEELSIRAKKAVETRRKRDPQWGTRAKKTKTVCWQDSDELHDKLAKCCSDNNLIISKVYAEMIQRYLEEYQESKE